jgi:hypothetical protein
MHLYSIGNTHDQHPSKAQHYRSWLLEWTSTGQQERVMEMTFWT